MQFTYYVVSFTVIENGEHGMIQICGGSGFDICVLTKRRTFVQLGSPTYKQPTIKVQCGISVAVKCSYVFEEAHVSYSLAYIKVSTM